MEWLLGICCFFLWLIYSAIGECVKQLKILNATATESQIHLMRGFERIDNSFSDLDKKAESIRDAADAYYAEEIKPRRGY